MNYTQEIAKFITEGFATDIDLFLANTAKLCFMDWLAVAIVGSRQQSTEPVLRLIEQCGGNPQSSIFGTTAKTSLLWAALANGTSAQALDLDDIYAKGAGHFTVPVISAAYPLCEWKGLDGATLLRAILVGVQVTGALNAAVMPDHYQRGWHNTGTMGHFGATAASSLVLGLNADEICYALGVAASQVASTHASFGTMTKPLHGGKAAMNGLLSSLLAADGFTASKKILDHNFLELLCATVSYEQLLATLHGHPVIQDLNFKYYACGVATHPAIMSSLRLRETYRFTAPEIKRVVAKVYPRAYQCAAIARPVTGMEGRFSVQYCAAAALVRGRFGLESFEDNAVNDPAVQQLLPKILLEPEPDYESSRSTTIVIELYDGRVFEDTTNPFAEMGDANKVKRDVFSKFDSLLEPFVAAQDIERLAALIWRLDELDDVSIIAEELRQSLLSKGT